MDDGKLKLYLETTVFNFYFDDDREGHDDVVELFERIKAGEFEAYTSEFTVRELERAQEPKRNMMKMLVDQISTFVITHPMRMLAAQYVANGIVPSRYQGDATHIAAASVYGLDCIVSYNFKHINKLKTKTETAKINFSFGHKGMIICTAKEVLHDEEHV